jgi:hypothetical protein
MSEKLNFGEQLQNFEHEKALPTPEQAEPLRTGEKDPRQNAQEARQEISAIEQDQEAKAKLESFQEAQNAPEPTSGNYIGGELQQVTLRRELQAIRRKLPAPQRALSKLVHQPGVRVASEAAGKTVSRPSGLLGGGLVALLGTSGYLYLAKHIGFTYNYGVFLILFAGGFALGLGIELLVHLLVSRRAAD